MYLKKHIFICGAYDDSISGTCRIKLGEEDGGREISIPVKKIDSIITYAASWHKAYAVHLWFVRHCFMGDIESYDGSLLPVDRDELRELLKDVARVRRCASLACEILPSPDGDYGTDYLKGIDDTVRQISELLESDDGIGYYYYYASF